MYLDSINACNVLQGYEVHQCKEYACASSQAIAEKFRAFK